MCKFYSSHDIAILGYNNSTYTYYETCGPTAAGCDTSDYADHTISQTALYNAIHDDTFNGQNDGTLIW